MDHKELGTNAVNTSVNDGSTKYALSSPTLREAGSRNKSYDVGSNTLAKVDTTSTRPCAIIGPDRVLQPNPDDILFLKKMPDDTWPAPENFYRRPPDYPNKLSDYQPTRNISPRQTFQENMQRIMVPPTFSSMKNSDESSLKNSKINMPQEAKYCDVPYNINSVSSEHKSVRNSDIPISNVNPSYNRNVPPPYGWPASVNVRASRSYGVPDFYQYQEYPSCAGPRSMTMIRPHRPLHEESAQVYSERLYQDANIRFKPYPTGKEKNQQPRYDYISNYPNTFHPPASLPPHKYDLQKTIHGHPYPIYPQVPFKYFDRRIHEPFADGYHRSSNQQTNFNVFHNQVGPPPYGPIPGNCMQNKPYSDVSSKPMNVNKLQFENNNKVYLNLESRNKSYSDLYFNDINHSQAMRGEILLPTHSTLNIHPMSQHSIYRKDNTPIKSHEYNPNYRIYDQSVNVNHSLQRLPLQFSPNTLAISPSDSNTSNDTAQTIGISQEDCGYVSQSSTASIRSLESVNIPHDIYRRYSYNNCDTVRNTFHGNGSLQIPKTKISPPNKKNLNVRQFLQMWNEGDEEGAESNKETAAQIHANNFCSQREMNNQEQLYVLGLVNVPNEELGKYDHIQKISKLPENIKGYNSLEILNQYEELLETPHASNYNKSTISREYNHLPKNVVNREATAKLPRPISPLDVEAKISQSVIHKEVGCNFEIKPCSPEMLNADVAAPVQTLLAERMIEKVMNPIMSPNLTRGDNIKSQNPVNDAAKVASCKMISSQYSSTNSPNRIKTSNYSVQDLESNAGLCLASLPQLDNDIELNFPEINQQFIKANQIESNIASSLQNLPNIDLEKTHCFSQKNKNDIHQRNLSPQMRLGSAADKEFSKLSKFRKGKRTEFTSPHDTPKQDILNSSETAVLQRIDSVIIKNPDNIKSQDIDSIKITDLRHNDVEKEPEQSYFIQCKQNIEIDDLSSETAIDFSLNKTEVETAVSYLNAMDRNIHSHLSPLEGLNDGDDICFTSDNIPQDAKIKHNTLFAEHINSLQHENSKSNLTERNEPNNRQQLNQSHEVDQDKYDNLITVNSSQTCTLNEEYNVLVIRKSAMTESEMTTIGNEISNNIENAQKSESPICNNENAKNSCELLNEENLFANSKDTLHLEYDINVEEVKCELIDEGKKDINVKGILKTVSVEQHDHGNMNFYKKNEINSSEIPHTSFTKTSLSDDENNYNMEETNKNTSEILNGFPNQNIDNLNTKTDISYNITKIEDTKVFHDKSVENIPLKPEFISQTNKENIDAVPENLDFRVTSLNNSENGKPDEGNNCTDVNQYNDLKSDVNNKISTAAMSPLDVDTKVDISDVENVTSNSEELTCRIKNIDCFTLINESASEFSIASTECNQEIVLQSEVLPQNTETIMDVSEFECFSDKQPISNSNIVKKTDYSLLPKTFLEIQESKQEQLQNTCATQPVKSEIKSLSGEADNFFCDFKYEISNVINPDVKENTNSTDVVAQANNKSNDIFECKIFAGKSAINSIEKLCCSFIKKTSKQNSDIMYTDCKQQIGTNDSSLIRFINDLDLEFKDYSKFKHEKKSELLNSKNESLENNYSERKHSKSCEKLLKEDSDIIKEHMQFQKELYSPWVQKLLMFSEGLCISIKDKMNEKNDNNGERIQEIPSITETIELVTKNNIEALKLCNNEINTEFPGAVTDSVNEVALDVCDSFCYTTVETDSHEESSKIINLHHEEKYENKKENSKMSEANDNCDSIKPRKISKRSLSESALQEYIDQDDLNFLHPCKRKKGLKKSFVESHLITDDICNIIQTNRRNSISTFYNEDNVYIVIDNDLILTQENDESEKICYTEITEEYPPSIELTHSETDLDLTNDSFRDDPNQICEYSNSIQNIEQKSIEEDSWVEDVACIETVFSEDVAENIIIDAQTSPKKVNSLNEESVIDESSIFYDSDHIDKIKTIYGRTICNNNTQLIETLYRTPQMNVNKTLYNVEKDPDQDLEKCLTLDNHNTILENCLDTNNLHYTDILENDISSYKIIDDKEKMSENLSLNSVELNSNNYLNFNHNNDIRFTDISSKDHEDKFTINSCESSNDFLTSNIQKESSNYSSSSSPEVSSTTSEEKSSGFLLKITNCNGSRVSQINEISSDAQNKLSYKLTEKMEYRNYNSNFSSSRTLVTKAAQKYIPPLKETIYDLKVKLPLPQHRLHTLKQLKIAKVEPKIVANINNCSVKSLKQDILKKQKPKFEDVLKSIDEINFKRHKDKIKKGKNTVPKVVIKKNENGSHYASSSKATNSEGSYNPDLTGRKWQPWVFLEKNNFIDRMALQNKTKAVYCHRKNIYVMAEKFRKYKSVYNANFVISQPKADTSIKGNLKYTIRLKQI